MSRIGALWVSHSDRDEVDAGLGDHGGSLEADPPRRLADRPAADHRNRAAQVVERHVVEQHGVDAGAKRLLEVGERLDLDLDLDEMPESAKV
jgi:hypothetical protein